MKIIKWLWRVVSGWLRKDGEESPAGNGQERESERRPAQRARRQKQADDVAVWPKIKKSVEAWERCMRDSRVDFKYGNVPPGVSERKVLEKIKKSIPYMGIYVGRYGNLWGEGEALKSDMESCRVSNRYETPMFTSMAFIADRMDGSQDESMFDYGISVICVTALDALSDGNYSKVPGRPYSAMFTHWSESGGHKVIFGELIVSDDGVVHPSYSWKTEVTRIRSKRGKGHRVYNNPKRVLKANDILMKKRDGWDHDGWYMCTEATMAFHFALTAEMHWNVSVSSAGVPPLRFAIPEGDMPSLFPKKQRDGRGKIVHWTRAHKRETGRGAVSVRTHIRGNTSWKIDGRHVLITMPGKHHSLLGFERVVESSVSSVKNIKDPVTGLWYGTLPGSKIDRILRSAKVSEMNKQELAA